jgi:molybdopterin converting factor subunit 1
MAELLVYGVRVNVRLFAGIREAVGRSEVQLDVGDGATPEEVWRRLAADHPSLAPRRPSLTAAVNRRYSAFDAVLRDGDEVVFVPPVSGG